MRQCEERMLIWSDTACHAAEGAPTTLTLCQRGAGPRPPRNGVGDAARGLPCPEGEASGLAVLPHPARVHQGGLHCSGPVAGLTAPRAWLRASLDGFFSL